MSQGRWITPPPPFFKTSPARAPARALQDLVLVDCEDGMTLRTLLQFYSREVHLVFNDTKLPELLKYFKTGKGHLAVVRHVNSQGEGDPFYENTGIVTLEDVIEYLIRDEIVDESDVYIDVETKKKVKRVRRKSSRSCCSCCSCWSCCYLSFSAKTLFFYTRPTPHKKSARGLRPEQKIFRQKNTRLTLFSAIDLRFPQVKRFTPDAWGSARSHVRLTPQQASACASFLNNNMPLFGKARFDLAAVTRIVAEAAVREVQVRFVSGRRSLRQTRPLVH